MKHVYNPIQRFILDSILRILSRMQTVHESWFNVLVLLNDLSSVVYPPAAAGRLCLSNQAWIATGRKVNVCLRFQRKQRNWTKHGFPNNRIYTKHTAAISSVVVYSLLLFFWYCLQLCTFESLLYRLIMRTQDMKTHLHAYSVRFTFCHCDLLQTYEKKSFSVFPVENKDKISFSHRFVIYFSG